MKNETPRVVPHFNLNFAAYAFPSLSLAASRTAPSLRSTRRSLLRCKIKIEMGSLFAPFGGRKLMMGKQAFRR